jgi:hypothetical protein
MSELLSATTNNFAFEKWECLDSDTGEDLAEEVRKYHIPDFTNWKNPPPLNAPSPGWKKICAPDSVNNFPQRRRRGIFVVSPPPKSQAP